MSLQPLGPDFQHSGGYEACGVPSHVMLTLLCALVITSVDYCCSVLTGVSGALLQRRGLFSPC